MTVKIPFEPFIFLADKVYLHHWPLDSPKWSTTIKESIDPINKNNEKKKIQVKENHIKINDLVVDHLKKIGATVPLFKKETTMVFEGQIEEYFAHIHITSKGRNYLETFNRVMNWKATYFPDDS